MAIGRFSVIAADCPDPHALARFYGAITGWSLDDDEPDGEWAQLVNNGGATIAFQRADAYRPPVWPTPSAWYWRAEQIAR